MASTNGPNSDVLAAITFSFGQSKESEILFLINVQTAVLKSMGVVWIKRRNLGQATLNHFGSEPSVFSAAAPALLTLNIPMNGIYQPLIYFEVRQKSKHI